MFFQRLIERLLYKLATELGVLIHQVNENVARKTLPRFANTPKNVIIELPRRIINSRYIFLGDDVWLGPGSLLNAITSYPSISVRHLEKHYPVQTFNPKISIGNRVSSTGYLIIGAADEVVIEDDVLIASNVTILDNLHGYDSVEEPYKYQPLSRIAPVCIKRGCWIGQNVVILPGVTVGELAIVGANSVVTQSIPDRCIALGAPARVRKRWDGMSQQWLGFEDEK